jgi:hypothetical protein
MGQISLAGQALALHNISDNGLVYRTGSGTFSSAISGSSSFLRTHTITSGTVDYLAAAGTYTTIGSVPAGFRFVPHDLVFTIDSVTGSSAAGDTMPTFRVLNTNSVVAPPSEPSLANQITNSVTPFSNANTLSVNQWGRSSIVTSRATTAAGGDTLYLRVSGAYAKGIGGTYTALNGKVILTGYLY